MIYDISPVNNHQGNGSTINFDFNFYIDNVTQIKVYHFDENKIKRELVYELDYSISNVQNQNGGYITFPISGSSYDVLKTSEQISIELNLPISQELEYNNSSDVNLDTLEYSFDYLTRLIQILKRKLSLCVKVEECSEVSPDVLIKNINDSHKSCIENATTIQKLKSNIDTALKLANNYYDKVENFTNELLASNAYKLKTIQTTNCITELPQTINLEIVDGELVLKNGSTFILPNGAGNFERITTTTDVKRATFGTVSHENLYIQMHIPNSTGIAGLSFVEPRNITVGTEQPTNKMWYNTNENKIVNYTSSGAENAIRSFPIAVVKLESGVVTEIKQVFNGLGHFGIARFVDANVKMLIPNGRNADGTLKNIEYTTTKVAITTDSRERTNEDLVIASNGSIGVRSKLEYDKQANKNYNHVTGKYEYNCVVAKFSTTTTQTTMLEPKQTFRAVDWFDFNNVQGQLDTLNQNALVDSDKANIVNWLTPDYTAIIANVGGNLGSAYTAPCAGYYIATIGKNDGSAYLKINGAQAYYYTDGGGVSGKVILPFVALVGKGDVCEWSTSVDISYTSFVPLKGAN